MGTIMCWEVALVNIGCFQYLLGNKNKIYIIKWFLISIANWLFGWFYVTQSITYLTIKLWLQCQDGLLNTGILFAQNKQGIHLLANKHRSGIFRCIHFIMSSCILPVYIFKCRTPVQVSLPGYDEIIYLPGYDEIICFVNEGSSFSSTNNLNTHYFCKLIW